MSSIPINRMRVPITLNTTNYVANNKFSYKFPNALDLTNNNASLGISDYAIYNSTFNISSTLGNNTYTIKWIDGTTQSFTIPDGYYSFSDLNANLEYNMYNQKWYLQSTSTSTGTSQLVQYFIAFVTNSIQYKSEIDVYYVDIASGSMWNSYAIPTGATWTKPTSQTYPQIILSSGLMKIFGFSSQSTFPSSQTVTPANTNYVALSNTYPVLSPIFAYVIGVNMINNKTNQNPTVLSQIALSAGYGSLISNTIQPNFITCQKGKYQSLDVFLYDQNLSPLNLQDPELAITFVLEIDV